MTEWFSANPNIRAGVISWLCRGWLHGHELAKLIGGDNAISTLDILEAEQVIERVGFDPTPAQRALGRPTKRLDDQAFYSDMWFWQLHPSYVASLKGLGLWEEVSK